MRKSQSIISLDPIDRKKREQGLISKLLITRSFGGRRVEKSEPYGHYMFCGPQRSGKTASAIWYAWRLGRKYKKRKIKYYDEDKERFVQFKTPPKVHFYSNMGIGRNIDKAKIFDVIDKFDPYANTVRIVLIDEFHTYFPKGAVDRESKETLKKLTAVFSQLAKRNTYVISTAQVYGRLDKALREQCLYMIDCSVGINSKLVNRVILESDIVCDDLGRWAGNATVIWRHGLAPIKFDTKKLIRE